MHAAQIENQAGLTASQVQVGELRIGVRRAGQGPPLLLLHGAVSDGRVWRVELDAFADQFNVIAWDAPGCGNSSDPREQFSMADFADTLAGLLDALDLGPAHVLGHSWGSSLALEMYRRHRDRVRTLVLVGAYAGWAGSLPPDEVARRRAFALATAEAIETGEWNPASMPGLFSEAMPPDRAQELTQIMTGIRPAGTRTMARALAESDLRDMLETIAVPTLLVHGDNDQRSTLHVAHDLNAAIRRSILTVLPGLGHECYLEDAAAFERAVRPFLDAH